MSDGNGKTSHRTFKIGFACPCGNTCETRIDAKPGVRAAQLPTLYCTMCEHLPPMVRVSCEKSEATGLVLPTMVPPPGLGVKG